MRVLHVITGLNTGGAEAVLYRLLSADMDDTHEVISLMDRGFYGQRLTEDGIPIHTLMMPRGRVTISGLRELYYLIRRAKPDVVQTWMYQADLVGGMLSRLAGMRKVVWGVHNSDLSVDKSSLSTRLAARACAAVSGVVPERIICCSAVASRVHSELGYSRSKMVIVSNGVDLSEFRPDASDRRRIRKELKIGTNDVVLGMVGRWDPLKGYSNLMAALGHLLHSGMKAWRCLLVGLGMVEANAELVALLARNNVTDRVNLLGVRSDIPAVMNALDLHVLSSFGESFGNVTVEAMACGVPAVVTSVGAGELIVGDTGWVVPPGDPVRLANAIQDAISKLSKQEQWRVRQAAAREHVAANFGLDRMVQAYRKVWRDAAGSS
jgi:glycosyltransferase involved in cell wall biosynthesis